MSSNEAPQVEDPDLWHAGERAMQSVAGMRDALEQSGRVVLRDQMPLQHRQFFAERQQIFLCLLDEAGWPWATVLEGDIGFVTSPAPQILTIAALPDEADPARAGISHGAHVGALGIDFSTRRRNRINGELLFAEGATGLMVRVTQSFGNCPQYIQARHLITEPGGTLPAQARTPVQHSASLQPAHLDLIANADTFFIASRSTAPGLARSEGLDMSHRGGLPGFVTVQNERRLAFPDYRGNFFFNTLGNLRLDARCGLLFIDFGTGTTLQLVGRGRVLDDPADYQRWPGAERAVAFDIELIVFAPGRLKTRYAFADFAPQLKRLAERQTD